MSAIGSVIVIGLPPFLTEVSRSGRLRDVGGDLRRSRYQLLLVTPGSSPRCAISRRHTRQSPNLRYTCLLYTSDAADDLLCVDLGGRRIIKKKKKKTKNTESMMK